MASTLRYCIALWVLGLVIVEPSSAAPLASWRVRIYNNMKSEQKLFLHCKSKDDDLGKHNLRAGQQLSWGFMENIWSTTLFWCYMRNKHHHASLEVFWAGNPKVNLYCRYYECIWSVRDEGIYWKDNSGDKLELQANWVLGS